jgi:hypothetical protein
MVPSSRDAVPGSVEFPELFDVDVDDLAGCLSLVTEPRFLGRIGGSSRTYGSNGQPPGSSQLVIGIVVNRIALELYYIWFIGTQALLMSPNCRSFSAVDHAYFSCRVLGVWTSRLHVASVSSLPLNVPGYGEVYRYQGRANFPHQIAEVDRMITEDCKARNGGRPQIVDLSKQDLGIIAMGGGNSTTSVAGSVIGNTISGVANSTASGTVPSMRNVNHEILYKCVR